jgi:hypothetical protein
MWKYWSSDVEVIVPWCVKLCPEMLPEELGTFLRKWKLTADCIDKTVACQKLWILGGIPLLDNLKECFPPKTFDKSWKIIRNLHSLMFLMIFFYFVNRENQFRYLLVRPECFWSFRKINMICIIERKENILFVYIKFVLLQWPLLRLFQ